MHDEWLSYKSARQVLMRLDYFILMLLLFVERRFRHLRPQSPFIDTNNNRRASRDTH